MGWSHQAALMRRQLCPNVDLIIDGSATARTHLARGLAHRELDDLLLHVDYFG
jgi:hypothetical protein